MVCRDRTRPACRDQSQATEITGGLAPRSFLPGTLQALLTTDPSSGTSGTVAKTASTRSSTTTGWPGPEGEGRRTLASLTFAYLNEWIERQRADKGEGIPGADGRLAAALDLQEQLQRIRTGEPPCDIFVRWRPLHDQAIGWEPDINDGVRLNIRPFMRAELRKGGRAGAGILRWKPNISWKKDRGKEPEEPRPPEDFPWFWGCPGGGSEGQRTDFQGHRGRRIRRQPLE